MGFLLSLQSKHDIQQPATTILNVRIEDLSMLRARVQRLILCDLRSAVQYILLCAVVTS